MKKVVILGDKSKIVNYLLDPLIYNYDRLKQLGYSIKVKYKLDEENIGCDILMLPSKPTIKQIKLNSKNKDVELSEFLISAKKHANKIIWLDTSDSTGVTNFEVLEFVDLYLKKQLYKNIDFYKKKFYGGRIFTDFYHKRFGIIDKKVFKQCVPLEDRFKYKIGLSWNIGLGDMYSAFTYRNKLRAMMPSLFKPSYHYDYISTESNKRLDIFLKTTSNLERNTVAFQRKYLVKQLNELLNHGSGLTGIVQGKRLSTKMFRQAMATSKIMPSPYGWGEIGVRDYESFIYGALLIKPNLEHMITWPQIFEEFNTYVPFDWSLLNLENTIREYLENEYDRKRIAFIGQQKFKHSISENGMEEFCSYFVKQIESSSFER